MVSINYRLCADAIIFWFPVAILAIALKQFYSVASTEQLQWMLSPLAYLLELCSNLNFIQLSSGVWLDETHRISIVKSCAGINFLIISFLGYVWRWRDAPRRARLVVLALVAGWVTALMVNTLRVLISVYTNDTLAFYSGLSNPDSHRLIGIVVYFYCLLLQLTGFRKQRNSHALVGTTVLYLTVTLLIPLLRTWVFGLDGVRLDHVKWVVGIPLWTILSVSMISRISSKLSS